MQKTFFWHDYESFGTDPKRDRPAQFAGQRTTLDLEPVGEPLVLYCQPAEDVLPHPEACLVTGITPQTARERGLPERAFIGRVLEALGAPGTCGVGYNSLRFDDELTRFTAWRNFYDPYAREWAQGCSRWDLIDTVRLVFSLRPEGLEWPRRDDGAPSFRLEDLAQANGLVKTRAHDALSDVHTTIALARLIRDRKPQLYRYVLEHRDKASARALLKPQAPEPVLHVSQRFAAAQGCISPVLALAQHPVNNNAVICFDLRHSPEDLLALPVDELHDRLYTPREDLPEDVERLPLKNIALNRCPVLAPMATLKGVDLDRLQLDLDTCQEHARVLLAALPVLREKLAELFAESPFPPADDPEQALYDGFVADDDRRLCAQVTTMDGEALAALGPEPFADARLNTLLLRLRAREFPESLSPEEAAQWREWRAARLLYAPDGGLSLDAFETLIAALRRQKADDASAQEVLSALEAWGAEQRQLL